MNIFILSIDAGTTGITVLVLDHQANICNKYYMEFPQHYPQPGWVEHNGEEIWAITLQLIKSAFKDYHPKDCAAIGITNQRETTLIWNKYNDHPIHNAIVWQCRRTQPICQKLKDDGYETEFKKKTGLIIDSYFSGTKIKWLLDNCKGAREKAEKGSLLFGNIDSWLLWKLTGGKVHATDYTNASRTLIFNIENLNWDSDLLSILNIPNSLLPEVLPSSGKFGETDPKLFGVSIPITGIAGDQQAALFGQGCYNPGESKCTYGTGCFLLTNTGSQRIHSSSRLLTTVACDRQGQPVYALEGSVFIGGAVIQWLRDELQLLTHVSDSDKIAQSVQDNNGIVIVPAFTGLGAPYWDPDARGIITGLTRGSNRNHIIRAALECIAYQVKDILDAIFMDLSLDLPVLKVDGGAVANHFLMQFQADIIKQKIDRPINIESTAFGAGMLAGLGSGFWTNTQAIVETRKTDHIFTPQMPENQRLSLLNSWAEAVKRTQQI